MYNRIDKLDYQSNFRYKETGMTEFGPLKSPDPELEAIKSRLCVELAPADVQPLVINQTTTGWLVNCVSRLLVSREMNTYAIYPDLTSNSTRSVVITE